MNAPFELASSAQDLLCASLAERAAFVQRDCWVHTPTTSRAFQWMEYLVRSERVRRPRCMQIVAAAGMGKSSILQEFENLHPVIRTEDPLRMQRRVLLANATDVGAGASGLRRAVMRGAWPDAKHFPDGRDDLDATLRSQGVRVILLDETGDLMKSTPSVQKRLLTELKRINHDLRINIVSAAVEGLDHVIKQDEQLFTRFRPIIKIAEWAESQEFRNFLYGLERFLPFPERSFLDRLEMLRWLLRYCRGNTNDIVMSIHEAALWAIHRNARFVAQEDFEMTRTATEPPPAYYKVAV